MGNKKGRKIKEKNKRRRRLQQLQRLRQQRNEAVAEVSASDNNASDMEVEPPVSDSDSGFINKSHILQHQTSHTGEKPYQCNQCDQCFSRKSTLVQHQRTHTGEKPYQCDKCDKCFSQKIGLIRHQSVHKLGDSGEPLVAVRTKRRNTVDQFDFVDKNAIADPSYVVEPNEDCSNVPVSDSDSGFTNKSHLLQHQTSHTGEKPYQCNQCDQCFSRKSPLVLHQITHTGEKLYQCDKCDKCFSQKIDLIRHQGVHKFGDFGEPLYGVRAKLKNTIDQFDLVDQYAIAEPSYVSPTVAVRSSFCEAVQNVISDSDPDSFLPTQSFEHTDENCWPLSCTDSHLPSRPPSGRSTPPSRSSSRRSWANLEDLQAVADSLLRQRPQVEQEQQEQRVEEQQDVEQEDDEEERAREATDDFLSNLTYEQIDALLTDGKEYPALRLLYRLRSNLPIKYHGEAIIPSEAERADMDRVDAFDERNNVLVTPQVIDIIKNTAKKCDKCNDRIIVNVVGKGLASRLIVKCHNWRCENHTSVSQPKRVLNSNKYYVANTVAVYLNMLLDTGYQGYVHMSYATHIPQMSEPTWIGHTKYVQAVLNGFYCVNMPSVFADVVRFYESHGLGSRDEHGLLNIMVCIDGFYEHTKESRQCTTFAADVYTGRPLDTITSERCFTCANCGDYKKQDCPDGKVHGCSGDLEKWNAVALLKRSVQHGFRYMEYVSDGDLRVVAAIKKAEPYGPNLIPQKIVCKSFE